MTGESHPAPRYSIRGDGQDITSRITGRLVSLTLTDNRGFEADQLDIVLDDTDGKLDLPPRGAEIRVALGWQDGKFIDKGSFTVDEVEHSGAPDQLTIRARSADLRDGLVTQMERSFHNTTLGAIVSTIAAENDLLPLIAPALDDKVIDHIDQTNESSANLLTRLARLFDAVATVKAGKLLFLPAGLGCSASGKPIPVATITRQDGDQHRFSLAERESFTAVRTTYYDTGKGEKGEVVWGKEEEAIAKGKKKAVAAPVPERAPKLKSLPKTYVSRAKADRACIEAWKKLKKKPGDYVGVKAAYDDRVGKLKGEVSYGRADDEKNHRNAVKLAEKDAQKIYGTPKTAFDHSADQIKTVRHVYASKHNAELAARSEYLKLGRGLASFQIDLAYGRPELFPGVPVAVSGFKPDIDNTDWIATRVTHSLSDNGYTTALELEIRATEIPG
ncbi:MAG: phage late control D family protein [Sterolibacterium sp.]|nr:phage late control D family protein [Sterolibacterium sp.]